MWLLGVTRLRSYDNVVSRTRACTAIFLIEFSGGLKSTFRERKKTDRIVLKPQMLPELEQKHWQVFFFACCICNKMFTQPQLPLLNKGAGGVTSSFKKRGKYRGILSSLSLSLFFLYICLFRHTNPCEDFPERTHVSSQREGARRPRARAEHTPSGATVPAKPRAAPHRRSPTPSTGQSRLFPIQKQTLTLLTRTAWTWKLASVFSVRCERRKGE